MGSVSSEKSSLYSGRNSLRCSFVLNYKITKEEEENRKERRDKRKRGRRGGVYNETNDEIRPKKNGRVGIQGKAEGLKPGFLPRWRR